MNIVYTVLMKGGICNTKQQVHKYTYDIWVRMIVIISTEYYICNELRGIMARSTQFPNMITRSTIIYEIVSPGAAGSSIYI